MKLKGSDVIIYVDEVANLSKEAIERLAKEIATYNHGENVYIASTPQFKAHPNEKIFIPKPKIETFILS